MTAAQRFTSLLLMGALNLSLVPVAVAEETTDDDTQTTTTEETTTTTTEEKGPCAKLLDQKRIQCLAQLQLRKVKAACKDITDREEYNACVRRETGERVGQFKEKRFNPGRRVSRRVGHALRAECGEMIGQEKRACMRRELQEIKENNPGRRILPKKIVPQELIDEIKACRELQTKEERRACAEKAREEFKNEAAEAQE